MSLSPHIGMDTEPMNADMMASENVTSNVEAEIDDDEEDYSDDDDDVTGTEDDDITDGDDDFEFKDLEKEIYGRLGGPPPELKEAMKTLAVVDRNDSKKENKKEKIQVAVCTGAPNKSHKTTSRNSENVTDNKPTKRKEAAPLPEVSSSKAIPAIKTQDVITQAKKDTSTKRDNTHNDLKSPDKVECAKRNEENEAPKDDCGCIVM